MSLIRCLVAAAIGAAFVPSASAQEMSKEVKVDFKRVEVGSQNSPQFSAPNVKDKRWNPKIWLEIDAAFGVKKAPNPADKSPIVDSIELKYYVVLNKRDASGKFILLTASITYVNANEEDRESHAMAFASPSSLARALGNPRYTVADLTPTAYAIVATRGGALAGFHNTGGGAGAWWEKLENFSVMDGLLLPKIKTPFAPLFVDYDLESK